MASIITSFNSLEFRRTGGGVSFEERTVQPSDFSGKRKFGNYAKLYAESQENFKKAYPNWQEFADCFTMRRAIISINGSQDCDTDTLNPSNIEQFTNTGFVTVRGFVQPNRSSSTIPRGKYQCTNFTFTDQGNGYSTVNVTYQQYGEWELINLTQSERGLPDPAGR